MSIISRPERGRHVSRHLEPAMPIRREPEPPEPPESDWSRVGFESGDWMQHVSVVSEPPGAFGHDLLRRGALELPSNLRYAWDGRRALLIGEVPLSKEADEPLAE